MPYQAMGVAIINDMITNLRKSIDSKLTIPETLAPNTLRMPISLLRCSALKAARPKRPKQEMIIAIMVKELMICDMVISAWYCFCTSWSRNVYSNGVEG